MYYIFAQSALKIQAIDIFGGYVILAENSQGTMYSASTKVPRKATLMNVGAQYKLALLI